MNTHGLYACLHREPVEHKSDPDIYTHMACMHVYTENRLHINQIPKFAHTWLVWMSTQRTDYT